MIGDEVRALANASGENVKEIKARLDAVLTSIDASVASVARSDSALAIIHQQVDSTEAGVREITRSGEQTREAINSAKTKVTAVSENTE